MIAGPAQESTEQEGVWKRTKGSINLVHDIEGGGLVVVQGKDKGEGAEGLFAARQVGNVLPALFGRPHTKHNALQQHQNTSLNTLLTITQNNTFTFNRSNSVCCSCYRKGHRA